MNAWGNGKILITLNIQMQKHKLDIEENENIHKNMNSRQHKFWSTAPPSPPKGKESTIRTAWLGCILDLSDLTSYLENISQVIS
jgi:hypothetical protein